MFSRRLDNCAFLFGILGIHRYNPFKLLRRRVPIVQQQPFFPSARINFIISQL
ncbi:hypothetical protein TREVI0001_1799 [Treponema vincentii ATCC 35580]|uniref:Uncharacterized protein n=1 Tax=Treponema vincentii ATCC 35580 TaxID=596324 RepID=C8PP56_9SPIR|nr:hypothetical protein TREVI0001_1799 [Treponema vincentii ATCC 35580]